MKKFRKNHGITLISLVVTIIVLLILSGVTIATLTGENGILTRAQDAKTKTEESEDIEKIRLAVLEAQIGEDGYQEIDATTFQEALNSQFEGRNLQVTDNKDGSFTVNLDNMSKMYYVDSDGEIINNENMIAIGTTEELKSFRDDVNSGNSYEGKYIYLTDNITLDINEEWEPIGLYLPENTSPDDETNKPFRGVFDGKNYEVNGLYINTTNKAQGMFGFIKNAKILNLMIGTESNINGGVSTGGTVGYCYNSVITNVCNKGNINGNNNINSQVGGIVGLANNGSIIINSCNIGSVSSNGDLIGGIVGYCSNTKIIGCYNAGKIDASNNGYIGGIIGSIYKGNVIISDCYNASDVLGNRRIGGIVGAAVENTNLLIINNCYNVGKITGQIYANGIYGVVVSGITVESTNNYYLNNTINGENGSSQEGVEIKNEEEMKSLASTLGEAFEEDSEDINNGYPILKWQCDPIMGN